MEEHLIFNRWFISGSDKAWIIDSCLEYSHDIKLVAISIFAAIIASYTAFYSVGSIVKASNTFIHSIRLIISAIAMGVGIWAMHFIGMLALDIPRVIKFDPVLTTASVLIAVVASAAAFQIAATAHRRASVLLGGGIVLGSGISAMHYVGMAAIRMEAVIKYDPLLFLTSVLVAISLSAVALWLLLEDRHQRRVTMPARRWKRCASALIMGLSIAAMHYTGMSATYFVTALNPITPVTGLDGENMAFTVVGSALLLITLALATAAVTQSVMVQNAEAASHAKSEFLASMSHELRTPLNGVLGLTAQLARTDLAPEQLEIVHTIQDSGQTLLNLLNDILDLSKVESGHTALEETDFSLRDLASSTQALWSSNASDKGLKFIVSTGIGELDYVHGDCVRLRQVVNNLIGNAIKFTAHGAVNVRLSAVKRSLDGRVTIRVEVEDTGIGISPENQRVLFQRFTQADTSINRKYGGTGLGLAICQNLVTLFGGSIGLESKSGEGSKFWFTVIVGHAKGKATQAMPLETFAPAEQATKNRRLRILIAEDNLTNQKVIQYMLEPFAADLTVVGNGKLAVDAVAQGSFDLVLMDVQMPEMDGVTATRKIRSLNGPGADTPIIALTANAMRGDREIYLKAGMSDYVPKPLDQSALLRTIAKAASVPEPSWRPTLDSKPEPVAPQQEKALEALVAELDAFMDPDPSDSPARPEIRKSA